MELLATLDLDATNAFFATFFRLPDHFWRGFLASNLSSNQLIAFALIVYAAAPLRIKWALMRHLAGHPAGQYLLRAYLARGFLAGHVFAFLQLVPEWWVGPHRQALPCMLKH